MDIRILGPLQVDNGAGNPPLELGGAKQRALLALLILHRGEIVTIDRLIDELWGELAPAAAAKTLQGYVSRLRKALGHDALETHGHGYRLRLAEGELDAARFEQLIIDARRAQEQGALEDASRLLRDALRLWRGDALGDLAYVSSLSGEAARLEELRLTAFEECTDLDLALARHCAAVPELEALVRAHPRRERLRAQLMLALYRAGRQADALERHQEGRRFLDDELGLEPGAALQQLEHRILVHDPVLDGPLAAVASSRRRGRGRAVLAAGCLLLALMIAAAVIELTRDASHSRPALLGPDSVGVIGPRGTLKSAVAVPGGPARLAPSASLVWVASRRAGTLSAFDPGTLAVERVAAPGAQPTDLAAGAGAVWVLDGRHGRLLEVDPTRGAVLRRIEVSAARGTLPRDRPDPWSLAIAGDRVWITDGTRRLIEVDSRRGRVVRRIDTGDRLNDVAASPGAVWAVSGPSSRLLRVDPVRGTVTDRIAMVSRLGLTSPFPSQLTFAAGAVWVLNTNTATVSRVDAAQRGVAATIVVGTEHRPLRIAGSPRAVWIADADGTLVRIDPRTNRTTVTAVARGLADVAAGAGVVLAAGATSAGATAQD